MDLFCLTFDLTLCIGAFSCSWLAEFEFVYIYKMYVNYFVRGGEDVYYA